MKSREYNFIEIEKKWQTFWRDNKTFEVPLDAQILPEKKCYVLPQLPYPSGSGLHVGHAEVYTICDVFARMQHMQGKKVLQVIGWDSFGLPAENFAIKNNIHPRIQTEKCIEMFDKQIDRIGIARDKNRSVASHTPEYYKWTQWFFLFFYERGLAYQKLQNVNWCEGCQTVISNDQVSDGKCERCSTTIVQKEMKQWFIKITDYADKLLESIDELDWPEESKKRQKDWIGKSEGAYVDFEIVGHTKRIKVFTTRVDTIFGVTFLAVAPDSQIGKWLVSELKNREDIANYIAECEKKTEVDRQAQKTKTGVDTLLYAKNPLSGVQIPIFIADYVLGTVGTGALMGVPAHDLRDYEFAEKYGLGVVSVLSQEGAEETPLFAETIFEGEGTLMNSGEFDGMHTVAAKDKIAEKLKSFGMGEIATTYKLRDWSMSRQRFWGAPVPMLINDNGELKSVDKTDLPVLLPEDVDFVPTGKSPLTYSDSFQNGVEEKYGKGWSREVDTLDTFMCSSWYYFRYLDPQNSGEFCSSEQLKNWMPVDFYIGGPEHVNGHLLFSRFFTKVLFDAGLIDFDEPFKKHIHQGMIIGEDGRKMSKRHGNSVDPLDVCNMYGADTLRVFEMFMAPIDADKLWDSNGIKGIYKFLSKVNSLDEKIVNQESNVEFTNLVATARDLMESLKFNVAIARLMEAMNSIADGISQQDAQNFLKVLYPLAPHVTSECWKVFNFDGFLHDLSWPTELIYKQANTMTLPICINGKLKFSLEVLKSDTEIICVNKAKEKNSDFFADIYIKKVVFVQGKMLNFVV